MAAITVLLLLVSILGFSSALPTGAPEQACDSLVPAEGPHGPGSTTDSPYTLEVDGLLSARGRYFYEAGRTYNVTLRGTASATQFRGFLVQLRQVADQSTVADQLAESSDLIQQHACTPASGGFTHTSRSDKNYIRFEWTPRAGTGPVVFRYTVVQTQRMHWDALSSNTMYENLPTQYRNSTTVGRASVYWTARSASLTFSLRTMGADGYYAAVGFSRDRMMPMTDIVLGAINNTVYFVDDRFATVRAMPPRDAVQNVMSTSVALVNGQIEVNFTRPLDTGDSNDFNLTDNQDCFYLLVASGQVADFGTYSIMRHTYTAASMDRYCFTSGAGMITGLSVWLLLMIAAVQYLL